MGEFPSALSSRFVRLSSVGGVYAVYARVRSGGVRTHLEKNSLNATHVFLQGKVQGNRSQAPVSTHL